MSFYKINAANAATTHVVLTSERLLINRWRRPTAARRVGSAHGLGQNRFHFVTSVAFGLWLRSHRSNEGRTRPGLAWAATLPQFLTIEDTEGTARSVRWPAVLSNAVKFTNGETITGYHRREELGRLMRAREAGRDQKGWGRRGS